MKIIIIVSVLLLQFNAYAQEDAWIYLKDKQDVVYSIANPISILTQKAIDRKAKHAIEIDFRDVPVNESYISILKNTSGITVLAKSKWFNAVHVRGLEANINNLLTNPEITFIDYIDFADKSLNSGRISQEIKIKEKYQLENTFTNFNYGNAQNQVEMLNVDDLHLLGFTGLGIVIALMDAGFGNVNTMSGFQQLRDLGNILGGYDFYNRNEDFYADKSSYHGTVVLSTMAGYIESKYVGTAPDASYYLFRTENESFDNPIEESLWVEAAERSDSLGVDIINSSLGYKYWYDDRYNYTSEQMDGKTAFITKGANIAVEKGMLVVNSAGNEAANGVIAPADSKRVLSIGAVDASGDYAYFSSQGGLNQPSQKPDIVAQGWQTAVIHESDEVRVAHGTSYSSPIVAGAIACLWEALPNKTNAEIMQIVKESASQYNAPDNFLGYGIPDFGIALNSALSVERENLDEFTIFPNPIKNILRIKFSNNIEKINVEIYDVFGKLIMDKRNLQDSEDIDLEQLSSGMYFLTIKNSNLNVNVLKIIKE